VNLGDILIIVGILLPTIPFGYLAPVVGAIGGSIVITGTLMNEHPEPGDQFDIVQNSHLQDMETTTQTTMFNLMNSTFLTDQNYTAFDSYSDDSRQDMSQMRAQIKQEIVAWAASQFLNYYGLKVCTNPDDRTWCGCDNSGWITACNDNIQNTDCRLAGGLSNGGGGYWYYIKDGQPTGNIAGWTDYLRNNSYDDLCNNVNGWRLQKDKCTYGDYLTYYDSDNCPNKDPPIEPPCC
jgi:hypothetical protein